MVRDYFLGGNTNKGFFSYYNYLADPEEYDKVYIIKGGPGTGKSSLMKEAAKWGEEKGFDVDKIHCSSDPGSLDGLVISEIKIAMVDGTAPHIVDPKIPGAFEVIVNMGDFWDERAIKCCKKEIMECNREISEKFSQAYSFLAAAGNIRGNCRAKVDENCVGTVITKILAELHFAARRGKGRERKLFAEGITPEGIISYADSFEYDKKIILKSDNAANTLFILEKVREQLKCGLLEMTLIGKGVQKIAEAKKLHDRLEGYYSPHIDFDAAEKMKRRIFEQLEEYAQEACGGNKMV